MVWNKLMKLFKNAETSTPRVIISGLKRENKVFRESIQEEADAFLDKALHLLDDIDAVTIHVKSSGRGDNTKFELHSLVSLPRATITAKAGGRKLNLVLKNLFDELLKESRKHKNIRDKNKRHREGQNEL